MTITDPFSEVAARVVRALMRHRERYAKAWVATTGLHPAQLLLEERTIPVEFGLKTQVRILPASDAVAKAYAAGIAAGREEAAVVCEEYDLPDRDRTSNEAGRTCRRAQRESDPSLVALDWARWRFGDAMTSNSPGATPMQSYPDIRAIAEKVFGRESIEHVTEPRDGYDYVVIKFRSVELELAQLVDFSEQLGLAFTLNYEKEITYSPDTGSASDFSIWINLE